MESSQRNNHWMFASLFVLSGISGLVYQVVWARKFQIAFGLSQFEALEINRPRMKLKSEWH